jgi:hypothetical protein
MPTLAILTVVLEILAIYYDTRYLTSSPYAYLDLRTKRHPMMFAPGGGITYSQVPRFSSVITSSCIDLRHSRTRECFSTS